MSFDELFHATSTWSKPPTLDALQRAIPEEWIAEALETTATATVRRRRLPGEQVVWLLIGMGLFRRIPIVDCVKCLGLALPGVGSIARSSVSAARARLGSSPLERLFELSAIAWGVRSAAKYTWKGLSVFGIDGTTLRVPDSTENRAEFGGHPSRNQTEGSYPLLRVVVLMSLRSHVLLAAAFGTQRGKDTHEVGYATPLLKTLPKHSLTIVDRAYLSPVFLSRFATEDGEQHWLSRARNTMNVKVLKRLGKGDEIVEMTISAPTRRKHPELPKTWIARRIAYQKKGFAPSALMTSLQDAAEYPARELIELYHERWELELGYREIKSTLLDREEAIRSKTVEGVKQEVWGILLAYNLIRTEIERIALANKVLPTRISFVMAMRVLRSEWEWMPLSSPGAIPKRLAQMRRDLAHGLLSEKKRKPYPRAVKIKMSNYPRKKPAIECIKPNSTAKSRS
jgi:Insertion element 4 transposase N-terminal/Transposase DDE domain